MISTLRGALLLLLLVLVLAPRPAAAQRLLTLINTGSPTNDRQLGVIDPATGKLDPIGPPIVGAPVSTLYPGAVTIDPEGHRLFFINKPATGGLSTMHVVDTLNGTRLSSVLITGAGVDSLALLHWSPLDSKLYCVATVSLGKLQLCTVNTANGIVTTRGDVFSQNPLFMFPTHAMNDEGQLEERRFYFVGGIGADPAEIYSVDPSNGAVKNHWDLVGPAEIALPIQDFGFSLGWDSDELVLYCLVRLDSGDFKLGTIDPSNGLITLRGNPITGESVFTTPGATGALNQEADLYHLVAKPPGAPREAFNVDTVSGIENGSAELSVTTTPVSLQFDPSTLFADGFESGGQGAWLIVQEP